MALLWLVLYQARGYYPFLTGQASCAVSKQYSGPNGPIQSQRSRRTIDGVGAASRLGE